VTILQFIQHLYDTHGDISENDLEENEAKMVEPWDYMTPFAHVIERFNECMNFAEAGNTPFSSAQILMKAKNLVNNTGMFFEDIRRWEERPVAKCTWENFQQQFIAAQKRLQNQQKTAQRAGYHGHAAFVQVNAENQANFQEMMANFVSAQANAATDENRKLQTLTDNIAQISQQLQEFKAENTKLKQQLKTRRNHREKKDQGSYCWTHGYLVAKEHNCVTCKTPAPNHKVAATRENNMGGSQEGKPSR
jgi:hypothetical protein